MRHPYWVNRLYSNSNDKDFTVDLSKYVSKDAKVVTSYPHIAGLKYTLNENILNIEFPDKNTVVFV